MALVSSSVDLWNPCRVLDVYPNTARSTCVGENKAGNRCGWTLVPNDQFSASQLAIAAKQLKAMAAKHPSDVTYAEIHALAQNTLCGFHQRQIGTVEGKWEAEIGGFVREHGGMLGTRKAVKHSQREVAEETVQFDLNEVKKACQALEASQARCTERMEKVDTLEKDQAANSRNLAELTRQMAELRTDVKAQDKLDVKVERLETQMGAKHADLEKTAAAGSKETQKLRNGNAQLSSMMTTNNLELASLKAKVRDRHQALDERAHRNEDEVNDLRRQLEANGREIGLLKEAKASLEEKANASEREVDNLRQGLQQSNARHADLQARSDDSSTRFTASIKSLDQKHTDRHESHSRELDLLQAATASLEENANTREGKLESLHRELQASNARHDDWKARSDDSSRLLQTLDQKHTANHDDLARVQQEQDRRIEHLAAQTHARHDESKARSDDSAHRLHALDQKHTDSHDRLAADISRVQREQDRRIERLVAEIETLRQQKKDKKKKKGDEYDEGGSRRWWRRWRR